MSAKKKLRTWHYKYKPPALSGVLAASKSASLLDDEFVSRVKLTRIVREEAGKVFFPGASIDVAATNAVNIESLAAKGLEKSGKSCEKRLRNVVFTELLKFRNITFPTSALPLKSSIATRAYNAGRRWLTQVENYQEKSLAVVLDECCEALVAREEEGGAEEEVEEKDEEKGAGEEFLIEDRLLRGLNVTTTSLPDMTVLRGGSLYFGEFKNDTKYTTDHAAKQCTLYLYALLYFFRVRLGRPIKAVFGFFVCGSGCFHTERYNVGLVRLSAPTKLGESPLSEFFQVGFPTHDMSGLQLLVHFLNAGKTIEYGNSDNSIDPSKRIPALLTLPESLWESNNLVRNGTASMVFKGNPKNIRSILGQVDLQDDGEWAEFMDGVNENFKGLEMADGGPNYYLKFRLRDTTLRPSPANVVRKNWKSVEQIKALYCLKPFGSEELGVFLMHDCGKVLASSQELDLNVTGFLALFHQLWNDTMSLTTKIFHGDALPHNMAYDGKKLTLIDLDEGVTQNMAPKRNVNPVDGEPLAHLLYPNIFRAWLNRQLYTQLQLVASFLLLIQPFEDDIIGDLEDSLSQLQEAAATANKFIMDNSRDYDRDPNSTHENVPNDPRVTLVVSRMKAILGV